MNTTEREYRPATYRIGDKEYNETFISKALTKHLDIDTVFLIGTVKSMWEEAYEVYGKGTPHWDEYQWAMLVEQIEHASADTDPQSFDLTVLEKVLGDNAKAFVIKYGVNEQEMMENWEHLSHIEEYLQDGDIVYFDITHAFRSMAFYILSVLNYIIDVSEKKIEVGGVFYGMLDIIKETGYAPIVDLKPLYETFRWSRGAYSFIHHGNGYEVASLMEATNPHLSMLVNNLSNSINMNYLNSIKEQTKNLRQHRDDFSELEGPAHYVVPRVINEFLTHFDDKEQPYVFQLKASHWYYKKKRYGEAYVALLEALITFNCFRSPKGGCDSEGSRRWDDYTFRNPRKNKMHEEKHIFHEVFADLSHIRNCIAHHKMEEIGELNKYIEDYKDYYEKVSGYFKELL